VPGLPTPHLGMDFATAMQMRSSFGHATGKPWYDSHRCVKEREIGAVLRMLEMPAWIMRRVICQPVGWRLRARAQALSLLLIFVLALPPLWLSLTAAPALRVDVGAWGDHTVLSGIHAVERSASEDYRWTTGRADLALPNLSSRYQLLRLRAHGWRPDGASPPVVRLDVAGDDWGAIAMAPGMRVYSIMLPRDAAEPTLRIGFASQVHQERDGRSLGFALDWVEVRAAGLAAGPTAWQMSGQALLLALLLGLLWSLALPAGWALALGALLAGALVAANLRQPLWVGQALGPWLALVGLLLLASWLLAPRLRRALEPWMSPAQSRAAWALFVAALALRLAGSVHPLFNAHDLDVHTDWIEAVASGQLYLYSTPGEFRGQQTFNPPAGYLLLLPLALPLPDPRLVVQVGVALADAIGCLVLLPLARELRLEPRTGLLGMALYLALPINTTMLWWGFATNAIAQTLGLLLLWALLLLVRRPSPATTALFGLAGGAALLTHVGALALAAALLGLCAVFGWRRLSPQSRAALFGGLLVVGLLATAIYFSAAVGPLLGQRGQGLDLGRSFGKAWAARELRGGFIVRGPLLGFLPTTLAVTAPGLALLVGAPRRHPLLRALVAAWLVVCVVFLAADFGLGLLVRYVYFAAPLICLAAGALLAALAQRPGGRAVVLALVLLVAWSGTALWVAGVLERVKPSALPLTH
jgi:toxin CptA